MHIVKCIWAGGGMSSTPATDEPRIGRIKIGMGWTPSSVHLRPYTDPLDSLTSRYGHTESILVR